MRQINVSLGQRSYPILIGPGLLGRAAERLSALPVKRWAVVADETAASLYAGSLGLPVYTFPAGEGSKCLAVYESLCRRMLADGFTRADGIVALGGGVAGDLAGFLPNRCPISAHMLYRIYRRHIQPYCRHLHRPTYHRTYAFDILYQDRILLLLCHHCTVVYRL